MIVGTAGHVDHGKTRLVYALTGVDTDRLKEEKIRGISIELGYAYAPLDNGGMLGYIDVPGHEKLVHTMTAGAAGIDFALLVVAADDGIMPQTREHLAILDLLGVRRGAVAVTKIDTVEETRVRETSAAIAALLERSGWPDLPIFPVNAAKAEDPGIGALRAHLHEAASAWPARSTDGLFRLAVDRVFTLTGRGTVAAGTVHAGSVRVGDTVTVMPAGATARVRSIHAQSRETDVGIAGQRCALNLVGVDKAQLRRGDWLADQRALEPSTRLDVSLRWLDPVKLTERSAVHVHLGTDHRLAHVVPLQTGQFAAGARVRAQLVFEKPVCAACGDRFIVRDSEARHTIGGGTVLDACAPARRRRSPARVAYLDAVECLAAGAGLAPLLHNLPYGIAMPELVRLSGREAQFIDLPPNCRIVATANGPVVILERAWLAWRDGALRTLEEFHRNSPDEAGIDRGRWRRLTMPDVCTPRVNTPRKTLPDVCTDVWCVLVEQLREQGAVQRSGHWLHLPQHRVELSEAERTLVDKLQAAIAAAPFDPPWVRELSKALHIAEDEARAVLQKSAGLGGCHQVVRDLFYDRASIRSMALMLAELETANGVIAAAQFRDAVGLGRKRSIQILEFFDRVGYTRRINDGRKLRADSNWHEA